MLPDFLFNILYYDNLHFSLMSLEKCLFYCCNNFYFFFLTELEVL